MHLFCNLLLLMLHHQLLHAGSCISIHAQLSHGQHIKHSHSLDHQSLPHLFYSALKPQESKTEETAREVRNIHKHTNGLKKSDIWFTVGISDIK